MVTAFEGSGPDWDRDFVILVPFPAIFGLGGDCHQMGIERGVFQNMMRDG